MNRPSRWLVAATLAGQGAAAVALLASGPASAAGAGGAPLSGWWSATNLGAAAAPPPPDVKPADLLVQGSNAAPAGVVPGVAAPPSSQAVAAVTFVLPTGVRPVRLSLPLDPAATAPSQVSIVACRATAAFKPAQNGPYADAPPYASAGCAAGALTADRKAVTFDKLDSVARPAVLSVVLVPGPLDRVVLSRVTSSALQVSSPLATGGTFNPSIASGAGSSGGAPPAAAGSTSGAPPAGAGGPGSVAVPPLSSSAIPPPPPAAAAPAAAGGLPSVAARPTPTAATTLSGRSRLLVGCGLAVLLAFSLLGLRDQQRVPAAALPGRVRPPRGVLRSASPTPRGVGRFRAARVGSAPRL